jgi:anthranilate phosphoribosyltransferase
MQVPAPSAIAGEPVRAALALVMAGRTLSRDEAERAMGSVMDGEATSAQLAGLLVALRMRGETVDELIGFASAMRARAVRVEAPAGAIDTCGTGGDGGGTFNISTAAALLVAAAGVPVAKHGNRAITSASGSSDVLEALGVPIRHDALAAGRALAEDGFAFLFAPDYHPAMRHAGPTRREIGVRTAFNLIGPLTNPAGVRRQVVGCAEPAAAGRLAAALRGPGDGLDELPLDGSGVIHDVTPGGVRRRSVPVERLGLHRAPTSELASGSAAESARHIEAAFGGQRGPRRDVVLLNAGAALLIAGRARDLRAGVGLAARTIDGGAAAALLIRLRSRPAVVVGS